MDYLREVERRQRAVLTRLLTGERTWEETAAEEERCIPDGSGMEAGRRENLRPAGGTADHEEGRRAAAVPASAQEDAGLPTDDLQLSEQAVLFRQTRRADSLWRETAGNSAGVSWILPADGNRAGIEDISRAVQRDARRYDGGFTMF